MTAIGSTTGWQNGLAGEIMRPLADGWTLPASWYSDPAVLKLERERIFAHSWQYVGHVDSVATPGSFLATEVGHVPVVIVCDNDGEVRGFVNVCRHRGHIVAQGSGCRATLQCPYHAWTYGLDGTLRAAPRSEREPGFDADAFSLLPIAVDTWGPFVFANVDPEASPLGETIVGIPELVDASGVDLGSLRLRTRVEWEMPANWKNAVENYLECYHCPTAHPSLAKVVDVDVDSYRLVERELSSSQFGSIRPSVYAEGANVAYVPRGEVEGAQYHFIWPNTTVNIEAGRTNLSVDVTFPTTPGRSKGWTDYYYGADVSDEEAAELLVFSSQVALEDQSLVESVQSGLESGMVPQGRLLLSSEKLLAHFQRLVSAALVGD
jgi:phenylpropionate dioxygenase-like ring-hydroxylating dioxygenase large terminal subunit